MFPENDLMCMFKAHHRYTYILHTYKDKIEVPKFLEARQEASHQEICKTTWKRNIILSFKQDRKWTSKHEILFWWNPRLDCWKHPQIKPKRIFKYNLITWCKNKHTEPHGHESIGSPLCGSQDYLRALYFFTGDMATKMNFLPRLYSHHVIYIAAFKLRNYYSDGISECRNLLCLA